MAAPYNQNEITGSTDLTVSLHCVQTAATLIENTLTQPDTLRKIRSIHIDSWVQDDNSQAGTNNSQGNVDEAMDETCDPLIRLLDGIGAAGGSLEEFWNEDADQKRPRLLWEALYRHAGTLRNLCLDFSDHELRHLPHPQVAFPSLRTLKLDTDRQHGCDATAIDKLLKAAPGLENLLFTWPRCDLEACLIQNISWEYTFPNLKMLMVDGRDFAPLAFKAFLKSCNGVEVLADSVFTPCGIVDSDDESDSGSLDSNDEDEESDDDNLELEAEMLPNVRQLNISGFGMRMVEDWLAPEAARPIKHLNLGISALKRLISVGTERGGIKDLKLLELSGPVEDLKGEALKDVLSVLPDLQELVLHTETNSILMRDTETGEWEHPRAAGVEDLKRLFGWIREGSIKALRIQDPNAKDLPREVLRNLENVPESLEYLGWKGEETNLYKIERVGQKVMAVPCSAPRNMTDGNWSDKYLLEI